MHLVGQASGETQDALGGVPQKDHGEGGGN